MTTGPSGKSSPIHASTFSNVTEKGLERWKIKEVLSNIINVKYYQGDYT